MDQDVIDGEADKGGATEGPSPSEKEAGLLAALKAERANGQALKVEMAELRGRDAGRKEVKTEPVREFTRQELQAQVDDGRMTPDESDRILHDQMKRGVKNEVTAELKNEYQADQYASGIRAEVAHYTQARPDIMVEGSADRELVRAEHNRQVEILGKPDNQETELSALMTVFGPSNRLQNGREKDLQTHQETGSDGGTGEGQTANSWPKDMPAKNRNYYEHLINTGVLADRAAAVEEWNYKPKNR